MEIRELKSEDIPYILKLDTASFPDPWSISSFEEELKKDYSYYITAVENGYICGYAGIWCIYETAELIRIAVLPEFRKHGIGGTLVERVLQLAKDKDCERMMLEVRAGNTAAQALYAKYSFKNISVRRGYYGDEDAVIMERDPI